MPIFSQAQDNGLFLFNDPHISYSNNNYIVTLEVVCAFDERFPVPTVQDIQEILAEAKRIFEHKFDKTIQIDFHINKALRLDTLFSQINYQHSELYQYLRSWRVNIFNADRPFLPSVENYKNHVIDFLKQWDINSLQSIFYNTAISSYHEAYDALIKEYKKKAKWLRNLKTADGKKIVIENIPYYSFIEWIAFLYNQSDYDIIITNTLIAEDNGSEPYPHSIFCKCKIGGCAAPSPKRIMLSQRSVMISTFELYNNVPGFSSHLSDNTNAYKNKILGGYLLAHELGHAFYAIPDMYDHPSSCLMNTTYEAMDYECGYLRLISTMTPCDLCKPYVTAKKELLTAELEYYQKKYYIAGFHFLNALNIIPEDSIIDMRAFAKLIVTKAKICFEHTVCTDCINECQEILDYLETFEEAY
jgi:hypothetical protein